MGVHYLVLNAGSSSLKFSVFRSQGETWQVEERGRIEGLGTSPRLTVNDAHGNRLTDEALPPSVGGGRAAIDTLAGRLRP